MSHCPLLYVCYAFLMQMFCHENAPPSCKSISECAATAVSICSLLFMLQTCVCQSSDLHLPDVSRSPGCEWRLRPDPSGPSPTPARWTRSPASSSARGGYATPPRSYSMRHGNGKGVIKQVYSCDDARRSVRQRCSMLKPFLCLSLMVTHRHA